MSQIEFKDHGIGVVIEQYRLSVPVNQRSYMWESEHIIDLFSDIENAKSSHDTEYFLGTMVFTRKTEYELEVADGQQRLATAVVLLSAFRDFLHSDPSQDRLVNDIREKYLTSYDMNTDEDKPKLVLNSEDCDFFQRRILAAPDSEERVNEGSDTKLSHARIDTAARLAQEQVRKIADTPNALHRVNRIKEWINYLRDSVRVIVVIVPDAGKAFKIFETLNDRGLKLSQTDLLKNYLYGLADAGNKLKEVEQRWTEMVGALQANGLEKAAIDYIRQLWISYYGHVKEADLYDAIRDFAKSPGRAVEVGTMLSGNAIPYTALLNGSHSFWDKHTPQTRQCVSVMADSLRVDRIRPLMLSVLGAFGKNKKATEQAFRLCVSWTVRFLIVGGIGSGTIEQFYASIAKDIRDGRIDTPAAIAAEMRKRVPSDRTFRDAFARASVGRNYLARYYLNVLERQSPGGASARDAALAIGDEPERNDLEHVIPQKESPKWPITEELRDSLVNRIGNLALTEKTLHSPTRSDGFAEKKAALYAKSAFRLTHRICEFERWGADEINLRQNELAALAVKAWPITV